MRQGVQGTVGLNAPGDPTRARIDSLLKAGETVLWTGGPHGALFLSRRQGAALAFNLVWWALCVMIGAWAITMRDSPIVIVLMLVILIGVLQDTWRTGRWIARRIGERYVLTDQRILVVEGSGRLRSECGLLSVHRFRAAPPAGPRGAILLGEDAPVFAPFKARWLRLNPDEDAPRLSDLVGHVAVLELIQRTAAVWETRWAEAATGELD